MWASQGKISELVRATVLSGDDVLDLKCRVWFIDLSKLAIFTLVTSPFPNLIA